MTRFGHRPLGPLASIFNNVCLNNVFGDPEGDLNDKTNIPVLVRQQRNEKISRAKIEAGPGVADPVSLASDQLLIIMTEDDEGVRFIFSGVHFDAAQFETIAKALERQGNPDIEIRDRSEFIIYVKDPDEEKLQLIAEAWKRGIHDSLLDLGYEISEPH